ncbi:MAG: 3-oxoacyl-ACP reductase FabG [Wenzhouxiangella sp.]|jgi:3-oxoacyl-[acyl-carrier protein] reductase|nr:3-oxoacyl-ACP reductase FabG [Wenzhouxiangella sp.]
MTDKLQDVVLVTGASRGIGQAVARRLRRDGATVFGTATTQAGADAISADLGEDCGLVLNVTDPASIERALTSITDRAGAITVLINNAAITRDQLLMRLKDEDWEAVIDANLSGAMRLSRACLRGMLKARRGRIISISSVVGYAGNPGQTNYAAAKAGLAGFSRALAHEVGSRGITVNTVAPGFIDTDMTRALTPEQRDRLQGTIPLGYLGRPEDIAACVSFLAGPDSGYITGQTVHVNGGMYMT